MVNYFTQQGLEKLRKELDYLRNVKQKEIAKQLNEAASFGDLSENAAYHQAKEALAFLRGRMSRLEKMLANAQIIEKEETKKSDKIQIGSVVSVESGGFQEKFTIVGPEETNIDEGRISYQSPLGQALLGKSAGKIVEIKTPSGKAKYKILKIY